ncbi:hypothetical protein Pcinc_030016 [Petrolisthes cinctipes]|uniref:Uncharacterized protein n=1 Tax=Petrolisthes cinctipes TaxID=88211 RepID=A0AAE1F061_PETCI|nr:hypothetical protein Pcinc_030016 [Petrolisthes cinctipes]
MKKKEGGTKTSVITLLRVQQGRHTDACGTSVKNMKRVLLLLVLVATGALATKTDDDQNQIQEESEGRLLLDPIKAAALLTPAKALFEVATQIVILIALIFFIVILKNATGLGDSGSGSGYEYYHLPSHSGSGYDHHASGYDSGSSSSYSSGYNKRSADLPSSFSDLPVVQKLSERVHNAIENLSQ